MNFEYDVVGKIGSMALIRKEDNDIDYNIFSRLSAELRPGMILSLIHICRAPKEVRVTIRPVRPKRTLSILAYLQIP